MSDIRDDYYDVPAHADSVRRDLEDRLRHLSFDAEAGEALAYPPKTEDEHLMILCWQVLNRVSVLDQVFGDAKWKQFVGVDDDYLAKRNQGVES